MSPRSYLFVPANRPERFAKALASGADAVVFDLEDAVAEADKDTARQAIADWAGHAGAAERARVVVRLNDAASARFDDDLRLLRGAGLGAAMLPKAEEADALVATAQAAGAVLALVESARGLDRAKAIAATPGVVRLVFGTLDYALDLGLLLDDGPQPLLQAGAALVLASRLAGLDAPVAGVTPQLDDEARLLADIAWERRHGFGAKLCLHPRQVAPLHAALAPSEQALAWARRVVAADAASPGAARLDGRMVDRPVVLQALRTLQRERP